MSTVARELINEAMKAADAAARQSIIDSGERDLCGFAWVKIKPARGEVVKTLKNLKIGRKYEYESGYNVSSHSLIPWYNGQALCVKEAACRAFAKTLRDSGVSAYETSRLD